MWVSEDAVAEEVSVVGYEGLWVERGASVVEVDVSGGRIKAGKLEPAQSSNVGDHDGESGGGGIGRSRRWKCRWEV